MSNPYIGEIRMFAGNFAPAGWMLCQGQLLAISEFDALFNLIGTTYGGDGQNTFALPNLQSRVPIHQGGGFTLGQNGGVETVTLTVQQIPAHNHPFLASTDQGNAISPAGNVPADSVNFPIYFDTNARTAMGSNSIAATGGSQLHSNIQPFLTINFIISLYGVYPSPT